jgi:hypothetical protein
LPSGAKGVLQNMSQGDFLLLLESTDFRYAGQVLFRVAQPMHSLSMHIWGEERFPIIVLLQGEMISYGWEEFRNHFKFDKAYHMRGNTMRLSDDKIRASKSSTEEKFISEILTTTGRRYGDQETDFTAFANNLVVHMQMVKLRARQQDFRKRVLESQGAKCAVCDLAIPGVVEAAHIIPKQKNGTDDPRNGIALCATHHKMFDARLFSIDPDNLSIQINSDGYSLIDLRITRRDLKHLNLAPHRDALLWRWKTYIG